MLPFNEFRISIRLPPTKDHKVAEKELIKILTENPPYNAKVHSLFIFRLLYWMWVAQEDSMPQNTHKPWQIL